MIEPATGLELDFFKILQDTDFYEVLQQTIDSHEVKSWQDCPKFAAGMNVGMHAAIKQLTIWFNK